MKARPHGYGPTSPAAGDGWPITPCWRGYPGSTHLPLNEKESKSKSVTFRSASALKAEGRGGREGGCPRIGCWAAAAPSMCAAAGWHQTAGLGHAKGKKKTFSDLNLILCVTSVE